MNYLPGVMSDADWKSCKVLTLQGPHNWGDASKVDRRVILGLDYFAHLLKKKVLVTSGASGSHIGGSFHYPRGGKPGVALDFMLYDTPRKDLPDFFFWLLRLRIFTGIGIYSRWRFSSSLPEVGGFHADTRPISGATATWICDQKGVYEEVTMEKLVRCFT